MQESLFIDIDHFRQKKQGQNAYGDSFVSKRYPQEGRLIAVLSDGLGSGIKATILSQMTATMVLKFAEAERDLIKASEIIMESLPICQVRKISYATFSVIDCNDNGIAKIVEEGNPQFLWMRNGEVLKIEPKVITSKKFQNRHMQSYEVKMEPEDRLIFCSDGVTQSGLGSPAYKLGWKRDGLIDFVKDVLKKEPDISSRQLSSQIVKEAEKKEVGRQAKDDISSSVLHFRHPRKLVIFTGPPYYSEKDKEYAERFADFDGKKVICGGTTANLVSRELNRPIISGKIPSGNLPATSEMEGIDLVTEGVLTMTKAVDYLENLEKVEPDAAGKLVELFLNSDCIDFMVGVKLNQAHYDPNLPIELEIRKNIIKKMTKILEEKYVKKINLKFI